jgi:hypothetical protein
LQLAVEQEQIGQIIFCNQYPWLQPSAHSRLAGGSGSPARHKRRKPNPPRFASGADAPPH